jgi:hypothetical protein
VVKPLPAHIRTQISEGHLDVGESVVSPSYASPFDYSDDFFSGSRPRHTNETDDYEFLDEDDTFVDADVKVGGANGVRRRGRREIRSDFHVVFRRKDSNLDHASDYRESALFLLFWNPSKDPRFV